MDTRAIATVIAAWMVAGLLLAALTTDTALSQACDRGLAMVRKAGLVL